MAFAARPEFPKLRVDADACRNLTQSAALEWLETDGSGSYAMGSVAGLNTRRYHGLWVLALEPPSARHVVLSKLEELVQVEQIQFELGATQYPGLVTPCGFERLAGFCSEPFPTWSYQLGELILQKQLCLLHRSNTLVVRYSTNLPCQLRVRPFLALRHLHELRHADPHFTPALLHQSDTGLAQLRANVGAPFPELTFQHTGVFTAAAAAWYFNAEYLEELARGLDFREDLYCLGEVRVELSPERPAWFVATTSSISYDSAQLERSLEQERARRAVSILSVATPSAPAYAQLELAADAFVVKRQNGTSTIIAGYPWFADWGRDSMIALPGLLLARGLKQEARSIIEGFLGYLNQGLIPNRFPEQGEAPEYNTADATLWLFQAVHEYVRVTQDLEFVTKVFYPKAKEILMWHWRGTHHGIAVDNTDGLLLAGNAHTQITWMDAKIGEHVVTPRHGKAVEINALYYNALAITEEFARQLGDTTFFALLHAARLRVQTHFAAQFWNAQDNCLYDVIRGDFKDASLRPNQIFAASLPHSPLALEQRQHIVRAVTQALLTPFGLRSLAPSAAEYRKNYVGNVWQRDTAYHQGTVWPWLLGPYITAYLQAFGRTDENRAHCRKLLEPLIAHLTEGCLGQIAEIFDADAPHQWRGAPAQAWSVAELLRVLAWEL